MLFLSGLGAGAAGPSGWTRIAPWMRTTGETRASEQEEVRAVSQVEFLCPPAPEHPRAGSLNGCELPEKVNSDQLLLAFFSTWGWLDKGLQKDGGAGRHSSGWHWDGGYHHRFGLQGWLPGG